MKAEFKFLDNTQTRLIACLLHELAPHIPITLLESRLDEMFERDYQCVGIYVEDDLIGVCGLWILMKYYSGRQLEPDNVYIKPKYQSNGIGKQLCDWLAEYARQQRCEVLELNCYLENKSGQHFWQDNDFTAIGLHYSKTID